MRDLTEDEQQCLNRNECPFCRAHQWLEGPHGGLSVNVKCANCLARFNLMPYMTGQLIESPAFAFHFSIGGVR